MWWGSVVNAISGAFRASSAIRWSFVETVLGLGVPAIFPSYGSVIRRPLPSTGSLGSVPRLPRYYAGAPTPSRPSRRASLPSLGGTIRALACSLPQAASAAAWGLEIWSPGSPRRDSEWRRQGLPGSWGTPCEHALLSDPGGTSAPGHDRRVGAAFRCCQRRRLPRSVNFGAQSHGLLAPCLRFAVQVARYPRNTRFRLHNR